MMKPATIVESRKIPARTSGSHRHVGGKCEIFGSDEQTADDHADDAGQHACGQTVGDQIKQIPRAAARVNAKKAFEHIDQIDEKIKNEAVKNQRVQERYRSAGS